MIAHISGDGDSPAPYQVCLPRDSSVPRRRDRSTGWPAQQSGEGRGGFDSTFVRPTSEEESRAWFLWQTGHLHLFVYWIMATDACRRACKAIHQGDFGKAVRWLNRAATLRWGETAASYNSGAFSQDMYKKFIRPSMEAVRPDFSGRSARDYLTLLLAMEELKRACLSVSEPGESFRQAQERFAASCKGWWTHHNVIVERLAPERSLALREHQRKVSQEGLNMTFAEYREQVIQSDPARDDYDRYFGVVRKDMTLEEFAEVVTQIVSEVHTNLHLPPNQFRWLMCGDHLMLTLIEKRLNRFSSSPMEA